MWNTRTKLGRDLARWHHAGWVTDDGEREIRAELERTTSSFSSTNLLAILGVILLGFGAMSFVAANWQEIPKLARLLVLVALTSGAYLAAASLFQRALPAFAHAAVLLGVALFGASIMLVSQMYNEAGNPRHMVLIWTIIAFISGVAFKSSPSTSASILLAALWSSWTSAETNLIHWQFVPLWLLISAALFWQYARLGLYLSGATITTWVISLGYPWWGGGGGEHHSLVLAIGAVALCAAIAAEWSKDTRIASVARIGLGFALIIVFAGITALQYTPPFSSNPAAGLTNYTLLAALKLATLVAVMWWCVTTANTGVLWLGYLLFSLAVLGIYFKTVGSLLGSSVFFIVAGLLVIALAWCAHILRERTSIREEGQP